MPEALFCMWLKPDGFIVTTGQQPRNPHLGAGPEVPAYRLPFSTEAIEFNSDVSERSKRLFCTRWRWILLQSKALRQQKAELDFPETVRVIGIYRSPHKPNSWWRRLRIAFIAADLTAAPFILFYNFFLMFVRHLSR